MKSKEIRKFRESYSKYEKDCVFEGYKLAVLFDEKDDVKRYGGRWDADEQSWWMPEKKLLDEVHDNGTLVRDWLNDNQMIMGPYGDFKGTDKRMENKSVEHHILRKGDSKYLINWYPNQDAVSLGLDDEETHWFTVENARTRWDELISEGYNRIENS